MTYQSKTTVVHIFVTNWREHAHARLQWRLNIAHAVAVQIAEKCHMDIASITPYTVSPQPDEDGCYVTVVYNNNGYSLDDIYNILKPEEENTMSKRKQPLHKYRLIGKCTIVQYCKVQYPAKCELPILAIHRHRGDCEGHEIICDVDEVVEGISPDDAIGNWSLSKYEYRPTIAGDGDGLEPTWIGDPQWEQVE